ncbi:MAG: hypothetical protein RLZZ245_2111 [Verrucomicrobiota bacterium]
MSVCRLFFICTVALSALSVSAQEEQDTNGRELRLLAWAPTSVPLSLGSGEKALTLGLSTDQFTLIKGKQLPGGKTVEIFAEVPDLKGQVPKDPASPPTSASPEVSPPPPTAEPSFTGPTKKILYATGSWPAGARRAIAFLLPDGDGPIPKGKLVMLPDSPELHPEHTMRAINLTGIPLGIRLGEKKERVPVLGDLISPFDPGRLRIDIAVDENEKWNVVTGSYLTTARHYRCFALIRPQVNPNPLFKSDQPDIQNVFEQTSPLPARPPLPLPEPKTP